MLHDRRSAASGRCEQQRLSWENRTRLHSQSEWVIAHSSAGTR